MAMQLHISHSSSIPGIGMIAGSPYHCMSASFLPLTCTEHPSLIDTSELLDYASLQEKLSTIDPLSNLHNSKVWLQAGALDTTVRQGASHKVEDFYRAFTSEIRAVYDIQNPHTFVTDYYGNECSVYAKPYMSNCGFDSAGEILHFLYGSLRERTEQVSENLIEFSQEEFGSDAAGMAGGGFMYVPKKCREKECRLHVFLHGCGMNYEYIDDAIIVHSGFNEWAESNDIVIVYPQAARHHPLNYGACWDAKGMFDSYYDTKRGLQVRAIYEIAQNHRRILMSI